MGTKMKFEKSLPPSVEGKVHGYLKFVIDEVIWSNRNFGEIKVFVSWWGETDKSEFRPVDITKNVTRPVQEVTETYAIRTNISLFEEYIKNCECLELTIVSEETNTVLGVSRVTDLLEIFKFRPFFRYVPIVTDCGDKIGEIHINVKLELVTKSSNMQLKTQKYERKQAIGNTSINAFTDEHIMKTNRYTVNRREKPEENKTYKSILKLRKTEFQEPVNKFNNDVTDKLVAHVVARAQKLRGAILNETYNDNGFSSSDHSNDEDIELTSSDESKSLCTLSLSDLTSNSLKATKCDNRNTANNIPSIKMHSLEDDTRLGRRSPINSEDSELFNFVNHIKINVESFSLSPAGYRRVKSSSMSNNDNTFLSATYFVQYNMTFDYMKKSEQKWMKEKKPVRISSKKQVNQVIYFNHRSTYSVPRLKRCTERSIKFKVFVRHLNRKSLIELGNATICLENVIKTESWRLEQELIIVNKGIKTGNLNVIIELGASHFDKYIDNMKPAKENIPTLDTQQLLNETRNKRTKSQSKTSNDVSSISTEVVNSLTGDRNLVTTSRFITGTIDDNNIDTKNYENRMEDKVLLHGLIYVAEGRELPELNTYLICRAFWREDTTKSQVCNNTKNPFYKFLQLVPLIYDLDLLERIKDNYIIIEVYSKKNNVDNLLGLTKLSLHQLYVAYRDPRVLPHLLLSKYPVISVDGWVPIVDPVTGRSCGQLLVLVALGSAEQIALLEMSRGLRTICTSMHLNEIPDSANYSQLNKDALSQDRPQTFVINAVDRELYYSNSRTQECQTDITTVGEYKINGALQEKATSSSTLHDTIDHLAKMININKINIDQAAQTDIYFEGNKRMIEEEHTCMNRVQFNNSSDDSDNNSVRHNYHLPTEAYRSVGVGAEYNEEIDQPNTGHSNATSELPTTTRTESDSENVTSDQTMFRAIVEIECALHLPKVEKLNETVEPTTYASFQTNKNDYTRQPNSYTITNIYPHSCNPKWNWKCETELSTDLLVHDEKRLIVKIWRIIEPDTSMQTSSDRDVVIGFSAIDLSVLLNGFPQVSGWFHIMDFTGKCNGQIKVCITPLDNLSLFGKPGSMLNTVQLPTSSMPQLNWTPYAYEMQCSNIRRNNMNCTPSITTQEEEKSVHSESQSNIGFEDVSMSFLSLSLKQKLTELDEITKRLESRLRDVTSTAFEDDLENEFEPNSDIENTDYKVVTPTDVPTTDCKIITESKQNESVSTESNLPHTNVNCDKPVGRKVQRPSEHPMQNFKMFDNNITDYPERGAKTHINYLLDKLSLNLPTKSRSSTVRPIRRTSPSLPTSSNGNMLDSDRCNEELKIVPTQTDDTYERVAKTSKDLLVNYTSSREIEDKKSSELQTRTCNKMSMVIRDELIAEENNSTSKCDELTTYLLTSNVRHMDLNNIFSPLFYPYLYNMDRSPEEETVEQLDNRYTKVFNTSINDKLNKTYSSLESPPENAKVCRMTPSGVPENINDSIDFTILHKSSCNDLLASNSTESTTTISGDKSMEKSIDSEILENCESSETSVLAFSRQAPDGGNPVEDTRQGILVTRQEDDETQHSSSGNYN
ncbi:C2 domain-containing protein 3 [Ceratina calcarata]|uniref:C2 domain-containing protein 3 n=1 Tax=Ceratina calcarata TaxID=156304 RepID=A0AAJ7IXV3_9HYME|nr:C2 domain-containing protein 3 [Ceratina calcarata]